jgi:hypothetical protein
MDSKHIESLLEKYWNAETSLEEEKVLHDFFRGNEVPAHLKETASLFTYFNEEKNKSIADPSFDKAVTKQIGQRHGGKVIEMKNWFQMARVAAGIGVIVAAVYLIGQEVRKRSPNEITDTESDPQLAFEETKKALLMISKGFHKAEKEASQIKLINEAEEKIQPKATEKKTNI